MSELRGIWVLAERERREAFRNRWFLVSALSFLAAALGLAWLAKSGVSGSGFAGLGRTAVSLIHLVALVVPLQGLAMGAGAIAGERDRGSWNLLLAQPLGALELAVGKFLGLLLAIGATMLVSFGLAGVLVSSGASGASFLPYFGLLGFALLLAAASISVGLLVSVVSERASSAVGIAILAWLLLVLVGDLGALAAATALGLDAGQVLGLALWNPLSVFNMAAIELIRGGLELLGPAGLVASRELGSALLPALGAILIAWALVPLALATRIIARREEVA